MVNWLNPRLSFPPQLRFDGSASDTPGRVPGRWSRHTRVQEDGTWVEGPAEILTPPFICVALFGALKTGAFSFAANKPPKGLDNLRPISAPQVVIDETTKLKDKLKDGFQLPLYFKNRREVLVLTNNSDFCNRAFLDLYYEKYLSAPQAAVGMQPVLEIQPMTLVWSAKQNRYFPRPVLVLVDWTKWSDALFSRRLNPPPTSSTLLLEGEAEPAVLAPPAPTQAASLPRRAHVVHVQPPNEEPPPPLDDEITW
jgi:hypothetical protein